MALRDRFVPWHGLVVLAFLVGTVGALLGSVPAGIAIVDVLSAVLSGLLWAFAVYIFVGTFRNYVQSYAETGGSIWNARFLTPFAVGGVAAAAVFAWRLTEAAFTPSLIAGALSVGFWAFVIAMALVLLGSYAVAGYREGKQ